MSSTGGVDYERLDKKHVGVILVVFLFVGVVGATAVNDRLSADGWWNSDWEERTTLSVTNASSGQIGNVSVDIGDHEPSSIRVIVDDEPIDHEIIAHDNQTEIEFLVHEMHELGVQIDFNFCADEILAQK